MLPGALVVVTTEPLHAPAPASIASIHVALEQRDPCSRGVRVSAKSGAVTLSTIPVEMTYTEDAGSRFASRLLRVHISEEGVS